MQMRTYKILFLFLLSLAAAKPTSFAQEPEVSQSPIANATTTVIASIDANKVDFPDWFSKDSATEEFFGVADALRSGLEQLKKMSPNDTVFVAMDFPSASTHSATRLLVRNKDASQGYDVISLSAIDKFEHGIEGDEPRSGFDHANASGDGLPIKLLIAPPQYVYDTFDQLMPTLPDALGGGPTSVLTRGLEWASVGIDPSNLTVRATISSKSNADARALAERLPELLNVGLQLLPEASRSNVQPIAELFLPNIKIAVDGTHIEVTFPELGDNKATRQLITEVAFHLTSVSRSTKTNKFRSIILAMLNFESANQAFPPTTERRDKDGKPGLSWRVHILPYIGGESLELWKRFHLDEPWDSPHNKALLPELPDIYNPQTRFSSVPKLKPGYTTYVAPVGEGTVFGQTKPTRMGHIKDGTSKTAILLEVTPDKAVPWTAPQDYQFDPADPSSGVLWDRDDVTVGGFCDGHIAKLKREIPKETWLRLFQMDDGQPIQLP